MNGNENENKTAAIYETVDLPREICRIVADYAGRRRYDWTAVGLPPFAICRSETADSTTIGTTDVSAVAWHTFVSKTTLADGDRSWTIDAVLFPDNIVFAWIGFGLTIDGENWTNKTGGFVGASTATSWILLTRAAGLNFDHAGATYGSVGWSAVHDSRIRIRFTVDNVSGRITIDCWTDNRLRPVIPIEYRLSEPIDRLRPCIVFSGRGTAVVSSSKPTIDDNLQTIWTIVADPL